MWRVASPIGISAVSAGQVASREAGVEGRVALSKSRCLASTKPTRWKRLRLSCSPLADTLKRPVAPLELQTVASPWKTLSKVNSIFKGKAMQLVTFDATSAQMVCAVNPKSKASTMRLFSAKEFKAQLAGADDMTGNERKAAFNAYLRQYGKAGTGGLAAAMSSGELLVKGVTDSKNGLTVRFIKAGSIKDPEQSAKGGIKSVIDDLKSGKLDTTKISDEDKASLMALLAS